MITVYQPEDILEAAKTIRPFLPDLLGHKAEAVDKQLAALIACCQSERLEGQIAALLADDDSTREWVHQFLKTSSNSKSFTPLPGISAVGAPQYVCPEGDYIWHHLDSNEPIPLCPTHQIRLIPAENS